MDREAGHAAIHGVSKSRTRLSDWTKLNWTEYLRNNVCWNNICNNVISSDSSEVISRGSWLIFLKQTVI